MKLANNTNNKKNIATLLIIIEVLLIASPSQMLGTFLSPLVLLLLGITSGIIIISLSKSSFAETTTIPKKEEKYLQILLYIIGCVFLFFTIKGVIDKFPIDVKYSDIIPQVNKMLTRFLAAEMPYQPITDWGWEMFPTYMPLQWLPFAIPQLLHFDYRYFAFFVWVATGIMFVSSPFFNQNSRFYRLTFILLSVIYVYKQSLIFNCTYEIMMAAYYMLLLYSFRSKSYVIKGLALSLCLLSRYSVLLFVPLYFLFLFLNNGAKKTINTGLVIILMFLIFYILPFMIQDPMIFIKSYNYHSMAALGEWQHFEGGALPVHLESKLGVACYFYKFYPGQLIDKLKALQHVHLFLCILSVALCGIYYYLNNKLGKIKTPTLFLIGAFNIYITIFYCFIQIPYQYLFIVPAFISITTLLYLGNLNAEKPNSPIDTNKI